MSQGSVILKIIALPISILLICLGIMTILGGHITPGGGFQGGRSRSEERRVGKECRSRWSPYH